MSYEDMASDAGYHGEEAKQMARLLEESDRAQDQERMERALGEHHAAEIESARLFLEAEGYRVVSGEALGFSADQVKQIARSFEAQFGHGDIWKILMAVADALADKEEG